MRGIRSLMVLAENVCRLSLSRIYPGPYCRLGESPSNWSQCVSTFELSRKTTVRQSLLAIEGFVGGSGSTCGEIAPGAWRIVGNRRGDSIDSPSVISRNPRQRYEHCFEKLVKTRWAPPVSSVRTWTKKST